MCVLSAYVNYKIHLERALMWKPFIQKTVANLLVHSCSGLLQMKTHKITTALLPNRTQLPVARWKDSSQKDRSPLSVF